MVDDNIVEILENRLVKSVSEKVEHGLKWRYGLLLIGVTIAITLFGWNINTLIENKIEQTTKKAKADIELKLKALTKKADEVASETEKNLAVASYQNNRASKIMDNIEVQLQRFQRNLEKLNSTSEKLSSLEIKSKNFESNLNTYMASVEATQQANKDIASLGIQLSKLTKLLDLSESEVSDISNNIQDIISHSNKTAQNVERIKSRTTVFFHFSSAPRPQAKDISKALKSKNYNIPDIERIKMASNMREIRYFHKSDSTRANNLKRDVELSLKKLGYNNHNVNIVTYTKWEKQKPKAGVLELWLELPRLDPA